MARLVYPDVFLGSVYSDCEIMDSTNNYPNKQLEKLD